MNKRTLSILAAATSFAVGGLAFAADGAKASFEQLDANQDGFIERADIPTDHELATMFANYDLDQDNRLSASEFAAYAGSSEQEEAE